MKALRALALSLFVCAAAVAQNAALMPVPHLQFFDANGYPLAEGLVYTCVAGSSCPGTPLASYTDATAGTQNANPVALDGGGTAAIWLGPNAYKIVVETSAGVVVSTTDNVSNNAALSLLASNSASLVKYTPSATGGQTRTLAAIQYDTIDAGDYDTITHAFADACAATPAKMVSIPSTISASQTYTNSCNAPTQDWRFGTSSVPTTSRTFTTPMFGGTIYDASPSTSNSLSQGDSTYAPINQFRVFETGAANAAALYTEYHAGIGATGSAYGLAANVSADPGSAPGGIAHNWTLLDHTSLWITGCTRASNAATCTLYSGGPALNLGGGSTGCFYITGTTDTTFEGGGLIQCGTIGNSGYSIAFSNTGSNTTIGAGGWIAPSHQVFGFELNINNANHDPQNIGPQSGLPLPVWGFIATNTPFTWTNPTGGASIINQPITAGFFAPGGSNKAVSGAQYNGVVIGDAINDLYLAGTPTVGGTVSSAASAFRARPIGVAVAGTNYASLKSCWDDSVWGGSNYSEATYCVNFQPVSPTSTSADSVLTFQQNGYTGNIQFNKLGHMTTDSGSASNPSYGFGGYSGLGLWNNGGVITAQGPTQVNGAFNVTGQIQSNGTPGYTGTITCGSGTHINSLTVVNGIITAAPTCN